jgi:branched-chain amino acid transport system permease protein
MPRPAAGAAALPEPASRAALKYLGAMALAAAPLAVAYNDNYWVNIIALTYLMGGLATAWNIIGGFGGQFSAGHGVFFGIGAYMTAQFYLIAGVSPWLALPFVALVAAVVSALLSWPTFRLRGKFFTIATMAFNEVALVLAIYFEPYTGGASGLLIPFRPGLANMIFKAQQNYALLMFGFLAFTVLVSVAIRRSRLGYYLLALREDEDAARASGVNVLSVKLWGMAISAALTGIGGTLFTMFIRYIDPPTLFSLPEIGIKFALITLIGGMGTVFGPMLGAAFVVPLENYLRATMGGIPGVHLVVLGFLLILAPLFMKRGIAGALAALPWFKGGSRR